MELEFRSTLSWDLQKMPEIPPFTLPEIPPFTLPRIEYRFQEFEPLDYQPMQIFINTGALKTRDEPRS